MLSHYLIAARKFDRIAVKPSQTALYNNPPPKRQNMMDNEQTEFHERGWIGPIPLVSQRSAQALLQIGRRSLGRFMPPRAMSIDLPDNAFEERPWFKSMHAYIPEYMNLAAHPSILTRVMTLLGPDVLVWGVTLVRKKPGDIHRWHVDVEHRRWRGVTAFVALDGTKPGYSGLKFIDGSHRISEAPQNHHVGNDNEALALASKYDSRAQLSEPPVTDGQVLLFDGMMWHGSENRTDQTRTAMTIQYSAPDERIAIPLNWDEPIIWHSYAPPCIVVAGQDSLRKNRIVSRASNCPVSPSSARLE
jgi:hypothetical protein